MTKLGIKKNINSNHGFDSRYTAFVHMYKPFMSDIDKIKDHTDYLKGLMKQFGYVFDHIDLNAPQITTEDIDKCGERFKNLYYYYLNVVMLNNVKNNPKIQEQYDTRVCRFIAAMYLFDEELDNPNMKNSLFNCSKIINAYQNDIIKVKSYDPEIDDNDIATNPDNDDLTNANTTLSTVKDNACTKTKVPIEGSHIVDEHKKIEYQTNVEPVHILHADENGSIVNLTKIANDIVTNALDTDVLDRKTESPTFQPEFNESEMSKLVINDQNAVRDNTSDMSSEKPMATTPSGEAVNVNVQEPILNVSDNELITNSISNTNEEEEEEAPNVNVYESVLKQKSNLPENKLTEPITIKVPPHQMSGEEVEELFHHPLKLQAYIHSCIKQTNIEKPLPLPLPLTYDPEQLEEIPGIDLSQEHAINNANISEETQNILASLNKGLKELGLSSILFDETDYRTFMKNLKSGTFDYQKMTTMVATYLSDLRQNPNEARRIAADFKYSVLNNVSKDIRKSINYQKPLPAEYVTKFMQDLKQIRSNNPTFDAILNELTSDYNFGFNESDPSSYEHVKTIFDKVSSYKISTIPKAERYNVIKTFSKRTQEEKDECDKLATDIVNEMMYQFFEKYKYFKLFNLDPKTYSLGTVFSNVNRGQPKLVLGDNHADKANSIYSPNPKVFVTGNSDGVISDNVLMLNKIKGRQEHLERRISKLSISKPSDKTALQLPMEEAYMNHYSDLPNVYRDEAEFRNPQNVQIRNLNGEMEMSANMNAIKNIMRGKLRF